MATSNQQTPVARRELITAGILPARPTPLMRALRTALYAMSDGVRTSLRRPQAFYNAGDPLRSCPTDRLAFMVDDALDALKADTSLSAEAKLEQALILPFALEAHVRAKLAAAPAMSLKEHALRVSRTDAAGDMTMAEFLANPSDPASALRAADMAEQEGREHLGLADRIRSIFHLRTRGSAA